jgi:hypothetical protein
MDGKQLDEKISEIKGRGDGCYGYNSIEEDCEILLETTKLVFLFNEMIKDASDKHNKDKYNNEKYNNRT